MAEDMEMPEAGSSRRSFLRRMAVVGLVGAPVVSSFSLLAGCERFPGGGGGGGNSGGGGNTTVH
jgi:hypothetical protein